MPDEHETANAPGPKKPDGSKADTTITITLTEEERLAVESKANGEELHKFLKSIALTAPKKLKEKNKSEPAPDLNQKLPPNLSVWDLITGQIVPMKAWEDVITRHRIKMGLLAEMCNSSDRSTGIVGGTFAEDALSNLLQACWRKSGPNPYPDSIADRVFDGESGGLLGSFSSKILVAHISGVIGSRTQKDLDTIRKIMNACAHWQTMTPGQYVQVSFEESKLQDLCNKLVSMEGQGIHFGEDKNLQPTTPRNKFILTTYLLGEELASCAALIQQGMSQVELKNFLP